MLKHRGALRTHKHDLELASFLSVTAGIINISGFLTIQKLTTNVTGHFAFFAEELFKLNLFQSLIYLLYIFFFFLGSFVSNVMVEVIAKRRNKYIYIIPTLTEVLILFLLALFGQALIARNSNLLAFCLLFAMGLQNSLVTTISNARVRTTHLTGLFTDLGIDLSQLFFYTKSSQRKKLYSSIRLRFTIIGFFFLGVLLGGFLHLKLQLFTLAVAATVLLIGTIYNRLTTKFVNLVRG